MFDLRNVATRPALFGRHHWVVDPETYVAFSGRITNAAKVAADLQLHPQTAYPALVEAAHKRWGLDFPDRLHGEFAFALWDRKKQQLLLGRDALGLMPFFVSRTANGVVYSTDIENLLEQPEVSSELDERAIAFAIASQTRPLKRRSFFSAIQKVSPGHVLILSTRGTKQHRYWRPDRIEPLDGCDLAEYAQLIREAVEASVRTALTGTEGVASHLSGGLDSSAVSVVAARQLREAGTDLRGWYSWAPIAGENPSPEDLPRPNDQRYLVELVADRYGIPATYVSEHDLLDAPALDPLLYPPVSSKYEEAILPLAAQRNVGTILTGWGGDELISHNGRTVLPGLLRTGHWLRARDEIAARAIVTNASRSSMSKREVRRALPPSVQAIANGLSGRGWSSGLVDADLTAIVAKYEPDVVAEIRSRDKMLESARSARRMQLALLDSGHISARTEAWSKLGSAYGIDYRYPLLDRTVVELALALPSECYLSNGWSRHAFRLAFTDALPDEVVWNLWKDEPALASRAFNSGAPRWTHQRVPQRLRDLSVEVIDLRRRQADAGQTTTATSE